MKVSRSVLLITVVLLLGGAVAIALTVNAPHPDPYVASVMTLQGDGAQGRIIFENNCSGCHGLDAKGEVGPSLMKVSQRRSDTQLITQVVSGKTPPMPSFQLEPQQMADLLEYLKKL
ncbi:c-type cytochrome [Anthocerotibacter panamensis]|uniref:c-type cytochrome n=1 Tax=Anthocerotibacter panamensis TaxID=2857077 RepID=UPI001C406A62|nr:cytochrome c [Anthocerotibacter panamensis]